MLVDHADVVVERIARRMERDAFAVEQNLALVRLVHAIENFHQRRFTRAVLAQQRVNLAGLHVEVDAIVGENAGKALGDAAHLHVIDALVTGGQGGLAHGGTFLVRWVGAHRRAPLRTYK